MPHNSPGPGGPGEAERVAQHSEELTSNWERTLHDMNAMADDREGKGYDTVRLPAGDTTPLSPSMGEDDSWGLSYVVPDNFADEFEQVYEESAFEETGVYQIKSGGYVFQVTECIDHVDDVVVFVAGTYDMRFASGLVDTALDRGEMRSLVKTLDHDHLGTIRHDDPEPFFPNPDRFRAYDVNR
ncbi:MAG: hypothetical protein ABEJ26_12805 [Halosimplex sp.]